MIHQNLKVGDKLLSKYNFYTDGLIKFIIGRKYEILNINYICDTCVIYIVGGEFNSWSFRENELLDNFYSNQAIRKMKLEKLKLS